MKLSVIIVNYHVRHFLEQCLCSVQKALAGMLSEIIVVDNNSTDGSIEFLAHAFPSVRVVANKENIGFARACNQGLGLASGEYILFLNPDTIVPEDCFEKCIAFFVTHPDAGALGVKMLDGRGRFLKESKRSFPSPITSLYKLSGLSTIFPRSRTFSRYHLGHLDENENNEVEVLAGAFMMVKKKTLEQVGGFDEIFFMYGEDVDLSYRIQQAVCPATGRRYKNYYFAGSSIIHFKGESTRKGSMNYIRMFYKAMSIFVRKHYSGGRAGFFILLIHVAIWVRASLTAAGQFIRRIGLPVIDAGFILLSFWVIKNIWTAWVRPQTEYEHRLLWIAFPAYTVFYLTAAYYAGLYDRWYKRSGLAGPMLIATLCLLAAYALLPEQYRFSRGILLFGSALAFFLISLLRQILIRLQVLQSGNPKENNANTLIIATPAEFKEVAQLMKEAGMQERILGRVAVDDRDGSAIENWKKLPELQAVIPFREVVFSEGVLSFSDIIESIRNIPRGTRIKIHASGSQSIVGSDSKNTSGEALSKENGFRIANPNNRRIKRLIDIFVSMFGILAFPVHLFLVKKPGSFFINCLAVLVARKTWVGYAMQENNLPGLRPGIIACNGAVSSSIQPIPAESLRALDYWYARDYEPGADIKLLWRTFSRLGG